MSGRVQRLPPSFRPCRSASSSEVMALGLVLGLRSGEL
jgi:hypothetical protein